MSVSLTCPRCQTVFEAADAEGGSSIRCPECRFAVLVEPGSRRKGELEKGDVSRRAPDVSDFRKTGRERKFAKDEAAPDPLGPVPEPPRGPKPSPEQPPLLPVPVAFPQPPTVKETAPLPVAARVAAAPGAAPVVARPATPEPVSMARSLTPEFEVEEPDEIPRARFRHRTGPRHDDEDETEIPQRREASGSGKLLWIILGVVALLAVLGTAGAGYLIYRYLDAESVTETAPPISRPRINEPPQELTPTRPVWEKGRSSLLQAQGFDVKIPVGATGNSRTITIDGEPVTGARYEVGEAGIDYRIEWYDLPTELPLAAGAFARKLRELEPPATIVNGPTSITFGDRPGEELIVQGRTGRRETIRTAKIGPRVLIFTAAVDSARIGAFPGLVPEERLKAYFDSVRFTFNENTAPPRSSKPGNPTPKGVEPSSPPKPRTPSVGFPGSEGIKPLAPIDPFATAVYLPVRNELLTFGARGGGGPFRPLGPGSVVRRYSIPDFKLLATRELPRPVLSAVVDEKAKRFFVATANLGPTGFDAREQLRSLGDIQAFDLAPVLADSESKDELKPIATFKADAKLADLELSPDGKLLYTATAVHPGPGKKPLGKLLKLNATDLTRVAELELAIPVLCVRLSPDGQTLLALEHPFNAFGVAGFGGSGSGEILIVGAADLKKKSAATVRGLPTDLRFLDDRRAIAVVVSGLRPRLFSITTSGEANDVTAPEGLKAPQAGFLAAAPKVNRVLTSSRIPGTTGTEIFETGSGAEPPRSLTAAMVLPNAPFAGPVLLTPDGKYAVYGTGTVVDLSGLGGK